MGPRRSFQNVYYCDFRDYTIKNSGSPGTAAQAGSERKICPIGTTDLTNKELMDPDNNGAGVLRKVWTGPNECFWGRYEFTIDP